MAQTNKSNKNKQTKQATPQPQPQSGKKSAQQTASQQKKKQSNSNEKKCGCCKWLFGSLFLIGLIAGALIYDTNVNGRGVFAASATGKALKNAGLLPYVEKAWYTSMSAAARGYKWAEVHVPPYAKSVSQLACDLYKVIRNSVCRVFEVLYNFASEKLPIAGDFADQYIPGFSGYVVNFFSSIKAYILRAYKLTLYLINELILVNSWSPDNIRKVLNETQNAAWGYYYEFHKKVDAYAKLK